MKKSDYYRKVSVWNIGLEKHQYRHQAMEDGELSDKAVMDIGKHYASKYLLYEEKYKQNPDRRVLYFVRQYKALAEICERMLRYKHDVEAPRMRYFVEDARTHFRKWKGVTDNLPNLPPAAQEAAYKGIVNDMMAFGRQYYIMLYGGSELKKKSSENERNTK